MTTDNRSVLVIANAAITSGDYEGFLAHCTDDTEWNFIGDRILRGKEAVRQWMATTYKEPPKFRVEHLIAEGDFVIALGNITMDGVEYAYSDVWQFRDGKMAGLKAFVIKAR